MDKPCAAGNCTARGLRTARIGSSLPRQRPAAVHQPADTASPAQRMQAPAARASLDGQRNSAASARQAAPSQPRHACSMPLGVLAVCASTGTCRAPARTAHGPTQAPGMRRGWTCALPSLPASRMRTEEAGHPEQSTHRLPAGGLPASQAGCRESTCQARSVGLCTAACTHAPQPDCACLCRAGQASWSPRALQRTGPLMVLTTVLQEPHVQAAALAQPPLRKSLSWKEQPHRQLKQHVGATRAVQAHTRAHAQHLCRDRAARAARRCAWASTLWAGPTPAQAAAELLLGSHATVGSCSASAAPRALAAAFWCLPRAATCQAPCSTAGSTLTSSTCRRTASASSTGKSPSPERRSSLAPQHAGQHAVRRQGATRLLCPRSRATAKGKRSPPERAWLLLQRPGVVLCLHLALVPKAGGL